MVGDEAPAQRAEVVEQRLTVPVILAALASVPAIFLTMYEGRPAAVGAVLNAASLAVLTAEALLLFALAGDRKAWLRRNLFVVAVTVVAVPAVIFAVGPVQLLRLVRFVGALRIVRVRRIARAGWVLQQRAGVVGIWSRVVWTIVIGACVLFVALVLADPTSYSRRVVDGATQRFGIVAVLLAGTVLAVATYVIASRPRSPDRPGR